MRQRTRERKRIMAEGPSKNRAPRFSVANLNVVYDTGEEFWSGPVVDMSESGLFVETSHELEPGTRVTLTPDVPEDEALPFELEAEVVRVNVYDPDTYSDRVHGIAFRLLNLRPYQYATLSAFLQRRGVPVSGATLLR